MTIRTGTIEDSGIASLAETIAPMAMLLGGVPALTVLAMTAIRYVASGTI